ncbi:peptidylprolyl isomerase [Flavobacterium sp.]|uniref:peptidylprolyl isomerase n=1 Tax=Flavobacterium sp. TaxID=239 RepID=UPI003F69CCEC
MRFINNKLKSALLLLLITTFSIQAQPKKQKVDGVAAVVGDFVVLDSDIDLLFIEYKRSTSSTDITRCELLGKLLEDKMFAHHAIQDSIPVSEDEIRGFMNEQIGVMLDQFGTMDKVVKAYNKKSEDDFRDFFFEIVRNNKLTKAMQDKIVGDVEITPDEVRTYFNQIPKEERPMIGTEVEIAQLVIKPRASEEEKQKVIDKLKQIKKDVLENGMSFKTRAVLYTEDKASSPNGGYYKINRKTGFVKEFKDVAFSLEEGEISEPFETVYGYHIIYLEKILGQEVELRHILMSPKVSPEALAEAKKKIEDIKAKIESKELTFSEAAKQFSDQKETRNSGGILMNPKTFEPSFELTKMDPSLYNIVSSLKEGEISRVILDEEQGEGQFYKIISVNEKREEHVADFAKDFLKIKEVALKDKQIKTIEDWTNEKLEKTFVKINGEYRDCDFVIDWLKK